LKRERWGSPLVQEKYREEKACDKRHPYRIIIIIIIINWQKNSTQKDMVECVHNYTSTYARKQRYNWTKKHWYEHVPKSIETGQGCKVTILWNQKIQSGRTIPNNKPDVIIRDNQKGTCMLIDVAMSGDRNVIEREAEKILKYKDLTIEIQRMWNVKTKVISVIVVAAGTISK